MLYDQEKRLSNPESKYGLRKRAVTDVYEPKSLFFGRPSRTLAVVKAIMRDQRGVLESTRRSIEVVERYPGLLHFVMG